MAMQVVVGMHCPRAERRGQYDAAATGGISRDVQENKDTVNKAVSPRHLSDRSSRITGVVVSGGEKITRPVGKVRVDIAVFVAGFLLSNDLRQRRWSRQEIAARGCSAISGVEPTVGAELPQAVRPGVRGDTTLCGRL